MIRLYKQNGSVVVDGKHQNVALVEKITWSTADLNNGSLALSMVSFNKQGVIVIPLASDINSAVAFWTTVQQAVTTQDKPRFAKDKSIGKTYHTVLYSGGTHANATFYVFGESAEATPNGKAGLRVYSETDGRLIFDSRLPYLKVVGTCQDGMILDSSKRYGLLYSNPAPANYRDSGDSWDPVRTVSAVHFWWKSGDRLTSGWLGKHYRPPPPLGVPPLLVDLTGL